MPSVKSRRPARRVLVVDDSVDASAAMAELLRLEGHEVELAHDGTAAMARSAAFMPDVVLLDISLPGENGYDVMRHLREASAMPIVVIAITGYGGAERYRAREAGFDHFLDKPVDFDQLNALL